MTMALDNKKRFFERKEPNKITYKKWSGGLPRCQPILMQGKERRWCGDRPLAGWGRQKLCV